MQIDIEQRLSVAEIFDDMAVPKSIEQRARGRGPVSNHWNVAWL